MDSPKKHKTKNSKDVKDIDDEIRKRLNNILIRLDSIEHQVLENESQRSRSTSISSAIAIGNMEEIHLDPHSLTIPSLYDPSMGAGGSGGDDSNSNIDDNTIVNFDENGIDKHQFPSPLEFLDSRIKIPKHIPTEKTRLQDYKTEQNFIQFRNILLQNENSWPQQQLLQNEENSLDFIESLYSPQLSQIAPDHYQLKSSLPTPSPSSSIIVTPSISESSTSLFSFDDEEVTLAFTIPSFSYSSSSSSSSSSY